MRYKINSTGSIILADQAFMDAHYPGDYTLQAEPATQVEVWAWFIDIGPFYDRFGAAKMAVLTSTDSGVKAILQDVSIRKWIDLKNPQVSASLTYIGSVVPSLTSTLQTAILTTPVDPADNLALRKLYFA